MATNSKEKREVSNAGLRTASGTAVGAAAGALLGPIGAAVGAVVGGVVAARTKKLPSSKPTVASARRPVASLTPAKKKRGKSNRRKKS